MSSRVIPQQTEITCDVCMQLCEPHGPAKRSMDGKLDLIAHGEWTSEGYSMHLCDDCVEAVKRRIAILKQDYSLKPKADEGFNPPT